MELQNTVKEALNALYHHPDDAVRMQADRWLQDFQHTIDAWQVLNRSGGGRGVGGGLLGASRGVRDSLRSLVFFWLASFSVGLDQWDCGGMLELAVSVSRIVPRNVYVVLWSLLHKFKCSRCLLHHVRCRKEGSILVSEFRHCGSWCGLWSISACSYRITVLFRVLGIVGLEEQGKSDKVGTTAHLGLPFSWKKLVFVQNLLFFRGTFKWQ